MPKNNHLHFVFILPNFHLYQIEIWFFQMKDFNATCVKQRENNVSRYYSHLYLVVSGCFWNSWQFAIMLLTLSKISENYGLIYWHFEIDPLFFSFLFICLIIIFRLNYNFLFLYGSKCIILLKFAFLNTSSAFIRVCFIETNLKIYIRIMINEG